MDADDDPTKMLAAALRRSLSVVWTRTGALLDVDLIGIPALTLDEIARSTIAEPYVHVLREGPSRPGLVDLVATLLDGECGIFHGTRLSEFIASIALLAAVSTPPEARLVAPAEREFGTCIRRFVTGQVLADVDELVAPIGALG